MSRIDELIQQMCPDGVECKPLWSIVIWDKKFSGVPSEQQTRTCKFKHVDAKTLRSIRTDSGDVKLLSTGNFDGFTNGRISASYVNSGEVIAIPSGGAANIKYWDGLFVDSGNILAVSVDEQLYNLKYIYYYLLKIQNIIQGYYRGSGIQHPDMTAILRIKLPVPPLEIQKEIVKVLDNFTDYSTELQTELQVRIKQYEYYRNKILSFDSLASGGQVEWQTLGELCNISAGGDVPKDDFSEEQTEKYAIPIVSNGIGKNALYGYASKEKISEVAVTISARGTIGYAEYRDYPYYPIVRLLSLIPYDAGILNTKYLYYCVQGRKYQLPTSGIPQLTAPTLGKQKILVPSMEIQERIVNILDIFSTICDDLKSGLPAEIAARQKQYEYYRDKLLTFKELQR